MKSFLFFMILGVQISAMAFAKSSHKSTPKTSKEVKRSIAKLESQGEKLNQAQELLKSLENLNQTIHQNRSESTFYQTGEQRPQQNNQTPSF